MFAGMIDLSKLKIDFGVIEKVFIDGVVEQAQIRVVFPHTIALRVFPNKLEHVDGYGTMVRVSSVIEEFKDEIIELSKVTMFDAGKKISQAFMEVFKHEIIDHNESLASNILTESTKNFGQNIDYDNLELWIMVQPSQDKKKWILDMNLIYDLKKLRPYSIREEFKDIQKHV